MTVGAWFVDTNVAVYVFDSAEPAKQQQARAIFAGPDAERLELSTQVLSEFYVTASRKLSMSGDDLDRALALLAAFPVHPIRGGLVLDAVALSRRHQISYWDGLIVATAAFHGCERVLRTSRTARSSAASRSSTRSSDRRGRQCPQQAQSGAMTFMPSSQGPAHSPAGRGNRSVHRVRTTAIGDRRSAIVSPVSTRRAAARRARSTP